jgi:hypothetical protein
MKQIIEMITSACIFTFAFQVFIHHKMDFLNLGLVVCLVIMLIMMKNK